MNSAIFPVVILPAIDSFPPMYIVSKVLKPISKSIKGKNAALVLANETLRLRYSLVSDLKMLKLVLSLTKDFIILMPEKDS